MSKQIYLFNLIHGHLHEASVSVEKTPAACLPTYSKTCARPEGSCTMVQLQGFVYTPWYAVFCYNQVSARELTVVAV